MIKQKATTWFWAKNQLQILVARWEFPGIILVAHTQIMTLKGPVLSSFSVSDRAIKPQLRVTLENFHSALATTNV